MSVMQRLLLLLAGVLGGSMVGLGPSMALADTAEQVEVDTDIAGAVELARRALGIGRPDVTVSIARQILAADPENAAAHMLLAAGLSRTGAPDQAVPVAKKGFRLAEGKEARFEGAYLAAEAYALAGRPWASKLWLRKADLYAPTKQHEAVLGEAYRNVSAQSRLGFALAFFGGPSENVNGGSLHDTFWWGPFAIPITQALPGQVYGTSVQLGYVISPRTRASLVWTHREVALGGRAHAIDPTARERDYRQDQLSLGLDHVWQSADGQLAVLASGSVAKRWTAGALTADLLRGSAEVRRALGSDWTVSGRLQFEALDVPGSADADSLTSRLTFAASHRADWLGAATLSAGAVQVDSDAAGIAWRGPALALGWRPPIQSEVFGLTVDLEAEKRDYVLTPSISPDRWLSVSVTAELPSLEVMGFNPTVTLSTARTWSEVVVRDTRETGISFGISSQF